MDLLSKAYGVASDDDLGGGDGEGIGNWNNTTPPPPKRSAFYENQRERIENWNNPSPLPKRSRPEPLYDTRIQGSVNQYLNPTSEAPIPGRYISKRQRAALPAESLGPEKTQIPPDPPPVVGSLLDSEIPHGILKALRHHVKGDVLSNQTPQTLCSALMGHTKSVNIVQWSGTHAHLLASAGMDHTVRIWNVWSRGKKLARLLNCHHAAVKDVKWSQHGLSVLSCGYDCTSRLVDIEKGIQTQVFKEDQVVEVVKFSPDNFNLFLSGGSNGCLKLWDIRTGMVMQKYIRKLGPILDVEFTVDGKQLITSSDVSRSNLSENSIIVWDVSRQVPLSNQVYAEAYTCPCIRRHPFEPYFVGQSNGNYIAIFSTTPPFKLDKYKRYENHSVSGFPIKCNFSLDGKVVASGSSDGYIYFYNSRTSKIVKKVKAHEQACIDVSFHPILSNVVASCSWQGEISVFHQECSNKWMI